MKRSHAWVFLLGLPSSALGAEPIQAPDAPVSRSTPGGTGPRMSRAEAFNQQGEAAYHARKLDEAVSLYLEAISANPEHAQAYGNLGLAYQKLGRHAEARWAHHKALALASGPSADVIRASAHFNLACIHEAEGRWAEALEHYRSALALKEHPAYRAGIEKMKQKLGQK